MEIMTQKPVWVLTEELFDWMQLVCRGNPNRETLADVAIRDGFLYAADKYRLYRVPKAMITKRDWYVRHSEVITNDHEFDPDANRLPCARSDISSKRYPDVGKVINQKFERIGEITTRDLWIQCHDMYVRGYHSSPVYYTMPILDSDWQVQIPYIHDMLSLPHILGGTINVFKGDTSLFQFNFECGISVYISPYGV